MSEEIFFTRKDFEISWFFKKDEIENYPGNCKITHIPSGISSQSSRFQNKVLNQRDALKNLTTMVISTLDPLNLVFRTFYYEKDIGSVDNFQIITEPYSKRIH